LNPVDIKLVQSGKKKFLAYDFMDENYLIENNLKNLDKRGQVLYRMGNNFLKDHPTMMLTWYTESTKDRSFFTIKFVIVTNAETGDRMELIDAMKDPSALYTNYVTTQLRLRDLYSRTARRAGYHPTGDNRECSHWRPGIRKCVL